MGRRWSCPSRYSVQAKLANIAELFTKGAMEMVITINTLGHTTGEVNIDECASTLSAGLLTYQQNLDRSVYNSCYLAPVRWRHFRKRGHISKKNKIWRKIVVELRLLLLMLATVLFMHWCAGDKEVILLYSFLHLFVLFESPFALFRGIGNI